jgi:hypothetical protein
LPIRRLEWFGLVATTAIGAALAPGAISGDSRTMLITFLGLFSASILPTITLLINSMTSSGRSVQTIDKLNVELQSAIDALFFLFGCVVITVGALAAISLNGPAWLSQVPYLTSEVFPRIGQAIVVGALFMILSRAGQIPAILRRSLSVRHEIAVAEARRKLNEKAPVGADVKRMFASKPGFGEVVRTQEPES